MEETCKVLWLDPAPIPEDLSQAYRDYYTHGVSAERARPRRIQSAYARAQRAYLAQRLGYNFDDTSVRRSILAAGIRAWPGRACYAESLALHLPFVPGGRVLDVGCGAGVALEHLRTLGWKVEGADIDPAAVADARSRGFDVHEGDLTSLQLRAASFDAITMRHVIEHVYEPLSLIRECLNLLKPGGRLVLVTPNAESFLLRRYSSNWIGFDLPRHLHIFTLSALTRLVAQAGLELDRSFTAVHGANVAAVAARVFGRGERHDLRSKANRSDRIAGELVQQGVCAYLQVRPGQGEEIVVVARRP